MDNPHILSEIMCALSEKINQELEQYKGEMVTEELKAIVQLKVEQSIREIEEIYNVIGNNYFEEALKPINKN